MEFESSRDGVRDVRQNIESSRDFEKAVAEDPDYSMYYYNLACADAEEHKLADARHHLEQAFARKANMIAGEPLPDPTKDDSFLPYKDNKEFWKFVEGSISLLSRSMGWPANGQVTSKW